MAAELEEDCVTQSSDMNVPLEGQILGVPA